MDVRPSDINTNRHLWGAFGNMEREISALWVVRYCQQFDEWQPFTHREVEDFHNQERGKAGHAPQSFRFNGLDSSQWLVLDKEGRYHITRLFAALCYQSSPALVEGEAN